MTQINHPTHYTQRTAECFEIFEHLPGLLAAAIKYLWRYDAKGTPREDLHKCVAYCDRYLGDPRGRGARMLPDISEQIALASKIELCWGLDTLRGQAIALIVAGDVRSARSLVIRMLDSIAEGPL